MTLYTIKGFDKTPQAEAARVAIGVRQAGFEIFKNNPPVYQPTANAPSNTPKL